MIQGVEQDSFLVTIPFNRYTDEEYNMYYLVKFDNHIVILLQISNVPTFEEIKKLINHYDFKID